MDLNTGRDGSFSLTIEAKDLAKGLRPSKRMPRNSGYLFECEGAVGRDGVLQVIDELTRIDTSTITDSFPYPQQFISPNLHIICGQTKIYEWNGSLSAVKITVTAGGPWTGFISGEYAYLSNGKVSVERDPGTKAYSLSSLPYATAICNFKGQILIGAPDVDWS
jgi:hypothetical protein